MSESMMTVAADHMDVSEASSVQDAASGLMDRVWTLARVGRGSRAVQQALESCESHEERLSLAQELIGLVWEAVMRPHTDDLLPMCVERLIVRLAEHAHGNYVIQIMLKQAPEQPRIHIHSVLIKN